MPHFSVQYAAFQALICGILGREKGLIGKWTNWQSVLGILQPVASIGI